MLFSTKLSILATKLAIRYKVDKSKIKYYYDIDTVGRPSVIFMSILGKQGRMSQLTSKEIDSLVKKLDLYHIVFIIERITDNENNPEWTIAVYLPEMNKNRR